MHVPLVKNSRRGEKRDEKVYEKRSTDKIHITGSVAIIKGLKKSLRYSITVNGAERKSQLLRPIDHPGHGRGGSGGIEEKKREEEVNCSHLTAVAITFLSQIRSERLPPTMVSPLGRPGKTRQQQSRAIRASIMASTSRRDGTGGSTSAGAAGNRCQAEASYPARSQNE
ncbi:PREDICTED: uncharacterized protein LOC108749822 [Trachymyrmex septentrionalis]|uniref:uncharacterized protein LOC108749822 n=1 Tax=Trachymyrmex septentrionalis TaxID=34720 RepID=UPI00084F04AE|nr:PREDICTED: uncharacterized protein LOC108749822 [Trachymyrmex septentrionalis]